MKIDIAPQRFSFVTSGLWHSDLNEFTCYIYFRRPRNNSLIFDSRMSAKGTSDVWQNHDPENDELKVNNTLQFRS